MRGSSCRRSWLGSGTTARRRLQDRHRAGARQRLCEDLLAKLNAAGALGCSRAVIDGSHLRTLKAGRHPTDAADRQRFPGEQTTRTAPADASTRSMPTGGYDYDKYRMLVRDKGIRLVIAVVGSTPAPDWACIGERSNSPRFPH